MTPFLIISGVYVLASVYFFVSSKRQHKHDMDLWIRYKYRADNYRKALSNIHCSKNLLEAQTIAQSALWTHDVDDEGNPTGAMIG